jgi:hypothetical protein
MLQGTVTQYTQWVKELQVENKDLQERVETLGLLLREFSEKTLTLEEARYTLQPVSPDELRALNLPPRHEG